MVYLEDRDSEALIKRESATFYLRQQLSKIAILKSYPCGKNSTLCILIESIQAFVIHICIDILDFNFISIQLKKAEK